MTTVKTKILMIEKLTTERKRLLKNLELLSQEEMLQPNVIGPWSVKDILAHLADWEAHMPAWVESARRGDPVAEIEAGLSWNQFEEFNDRIYARHRDQNLDDVLVYFHEIHQQFMEMVEAMPVEEMLEPGRYAFIGKGAIYDWLSQYAGHDRWAKTHIRNWLKSHR